MSDEHTSERGEEGRPSAPPPAPRHGSGEGGEKTLPIVPDRGDGDLDLGAEEFEGDRRYGREDIADK